ncbi:MAG: RNA methyltransferase [Gammaproteobacteria bacterium]|nr:RNA methyltransferase [Gammaproteobacteria bacterium]
MNFENVRVVMVETTHPGNIGAAARAMKNMFLSRLYLVKPKVFPHAEATARASGADDLLAGAVVCDSLEEAVAGCSLVFGASARLRRIDWPTLDARGCGEKAAAAARNGEEIALVFGRESAGLTNEELDRCNYLVHIPSNPDYSSLNIGAAVQVFAYEVAMALGAQVPAQAQDERASAGEVDGFYRHLEQALTDIGFLDPDNPRQLMRRLRRLFNRAELDKTEVQILRGILTAAQKGGGRH